VVAVSSIIAVLIFLREPFRGYQTEVRLRGTASGAIEPEALRDWLRSADPRAATAISGGTQHRPQIEVRIGRIAPRLAEATDTLDTLARRILLEFLPQKHADHRQRVIADLERALQIARDTEQSLVSRSRAIADFRKPEPQPADVDSPPEWSQSIAPAPAQSPAQVVEKTDGNPLHAQLIELRQELARLLATFTDEHPQVAAIRRQIAHLEGQLGNDGASPALEAAAARPTTFTSFPLADAAAVSAVEPDVDDAEIQQIALQMSQATAGRQACERKLHATLAALSLESPAAGWSVEPARLVTRLGGTPRMLPLLLAIGLGVIATGWMFRATTVLTGPQMLSTTTDVSRALPIPLIGQSPALIRPRKATPGRWITPARVWLVTRAAEIWLIALVALCAAVMCFDHSLAGQFAADPFGVLSEIIGRATGR